VKEEYVRKDLLKVARRLKHVGARPHRVDTAALEIHFTDQARHASGKIQAIEREPGVWWWDGRLNLPDGSFLMGPISPDRYVVYNPYPSWVVRAYLREVKPWTLPRKGNVR
jgi:hypothetical protein